MKKIMVMLLIIACWGCSSDELFEDKEGTLTRIYVQNDLQGFFRLIDFVIIRENGTPTYGSDLLQGASGLTSFLVEDSTWKTHLDECDINIDIRAEVQENGGNVEIFEYLNLPIKCGHDYKWVLREPTPATPPYTEEGCMQTTSSAARTEDARIVTLCPLVGD